MKQSIAIVCLFALLAACGEVKKSDSQKLNDLDRKKIESLSTRLINSINGYDFSIINSSWNNDFFKSRVVNLNKTQRSVFEHYFQKEIKRTIKVGNLSIINQVNDGNGKVARLNLQYFDYHAELTLLLTFEKRFDFFKYRIEMYEDIPVISDFYHFKDNCWFSEKLINLLHLSTKFDGTSEVRRMANQALTASEKYLNYGDTIGALNALDGFPEAFRIGNSLSLRRLEVALMIDDSMYTQVLEKEFESNKNLYIQYLYGMHFYDNNRLDDVYRLLSQEFGKSEKLDSLVSCGHYWE